MEYCGPTKKNKVVVATSNAGKLEEIRVILADLEHEVLSQKEAGIHVEIEETGCSFEENALLKARGIAAFTDAIVIADDSGLEIDYLNKEPGVHTARYLGEDTPYEVKYNHLIERLQGVAEEKRTARFVCVIAAILPNGREILAKGVMEGRLAQEAAGKNGFGYDPVFYLPDYGKTAAQLDPEEKHKISHRGKALREMRQKLL